MVGDRKSEEVVDPRMPKKPSPKAFKRALLVAIRCVDPDVHKRPKMGNVIHMLEMDDLLVREVCQSYPYSKANAYGGYEDNEDDEMRTTSEGGESSGAKVRAMGQRRPRVIQNAMTSRAKVGR
ncbi:hypothetical protein BHM03_00051792 [Ensete ventricosum]|nr:hypothetical protein BHM03_00051792 [Ensete ventricosum]